MKRGDSLLVRADSLRDVSLIGDTLLARVRLLAPDIGAHSGSLAAYSAPLAASVSDFNGLLGQLHELANKLAEAYPACEVFAVERARVVTWVSDTGSYRAVLVAAEAHAAAMKTIREAFANVSRSPESTQMWRIFGNFDNPTTVELEVQRTLIGPDTAWRSIATPRLAFGSRRRFAIGVGGLGSRVNVSTFDIATRYRQPPEGQPGDTTERVIVESGRNRGRVMPTIVLSARVRSLSYKGLDAVHLSVGTAPRDAGSKLALDYLLGIGFSAADERILLSAGVASAEESKLADGYNVNDRLPASQSSAPIRTRRVVSPALALTFRVF